MLTIKQVLENFAENPKEVIGLLLVAVDELAERLAYVENLLSADDPDHPDNWDKEETHTS